MCSFLFLGRTHLGPRAVPVPRRAPLAKRRRSLHTAAAAPSHPRRSRCGRRGSDLGRDFFFSDSVVRGSFVVKRVCKILFSAHKALITTRGLHSHASIMLTVPPPKTSRRVIAVADATVLMLLGVVSYTAAPAVLSEPAGGRRPTGAQKKRRFSYSSSSPVLGVRLMTALQVLQVRVAAEPGFRLFGW